MTPMEFELEVSMAVIAIVSKAHEDGKAGIDCWSAERVQQMTDLREFILKEQRK